MQQVFKRAEKESIGGRHTIDGGGVRVMCCGMNI